MTNTSPMLVVAAALIDPEGRVLVQRRSDGALADLWEFPGGKVEAGETPERALVRELNEELALTVAESALRPFAFSSAALETRHLVLLLYVIREWTGRPRPLAASRLAWRRPGDLYDLAMPEPDRPLVAALVAASPEG